ncbi:MAG: toprim domain-containing protein [Streptosporangiaceae bacterium]
MTDGSPGDDDAAPPLSQSYGRADDAQETAGGETGGLRRVPALAVAKNDLVAVNRAAEEFFRSSLPGSWVPGYLTRRGFEPRVQLRWRAGYAPASWVALTNHLRALGFTDSAIQAAGLARSSRHGTLVDVFRDRAMLPIHAADGGMVVAFIGRAADGARLGTPKYLNSPRTALYNKSSILFGLAEGRDLLAGGATPVIVEGPLDAIAVTTAGKGQYVGVTPCGTALTSQHAAALQRAADLAATGVRVAFDSDPAGRRASVRAYRILSRITAKTSAVVQPDGRDPAQIFTEHGADYLAEYLALRAQPLADLVTDAELERWSRWLPYAEGQVNALRAVAHTIAAMPPSHVGRQVARLASRLGVDHAVVTDAVTGALPVVVGRCDSAQWLQEPRLPGNEAAARLAPPRRQYDGAISSHHTGRSP